MTNTLEVPQWMRQLGFFSRTRAIGSKRTADELSLTASRLAVEHRAYVSGETI